MLVRGYVYTKYFVRDSPIGVRFCTRPLRCVVSYLVDASLEDKGRKHDQTERKSSKGDRRPCLLFSALNPASLACATLPCLIGPFCFWCVGSAAVLVRGEIAVVLV